MADQGSGDSFVASAAKLASVIASTSNTGRTSRRGMRLKAHTYSLFFGTPSQGVTFGDLHDLVHRALKAIDATNPSMGIMFRLLVQLVSPSSLDLDKARYHKTDRLRQIPEIMLFVILRTSIAANPACASALRPHFLISPRVTAVIERKNRAELLIAKSSWSSALDPVVAATTVSCSSGQLEVDDASSFISDSSTEVSELHFLLENRTIAAPSCGSWGASPPLGLRVNQKSSNDIEKDGDVVTRCSATHTKQISFALPFRRLQHESNDFKNGMLFVAMHRAIQGLPDPYSITCVESDPYPLIRLRDPEAYRAELSLLKWCCDKGTAFLRLQLVISLAELSWQKGPLGRYGCAAVCALKEQLFLLRKHISVLAQLAGGPQAVPFSVIMASFLQLQEVGEITDLLCDTFKISLDSHWVPRDSVLCCNVTLISALSLRRTTILRQRTATARGGGNSDSECRTLSPLTVVSRMLVRMMEALHGFITTWLRQSAVEDPFDEFFIVPSFGANACGFSVAEDRLPLFISTEAAEDILQAGVSRALAALLITSSQEEDRQLKLSALLCPSFSPTRDGCDAWKSFCLESEKCLLYLPEAGDQSANPDNDDDLLDTSTPSTQDAEFGSTAAPNLASEHMSIAKAPGSDDHPLSPDRDRLEQDQEALKAAASAHLYSQHQLQMRVEHYKERLLKWKSKRIALTRIRRIAIDRTVEDVGNMQQLLISDPTRVTPVRQLVVPLSETSVLTPQEAVGSPITEIRPASDFAAQVEKVLFGPALVLGVVEANNAHERRAFEDEAENGEVVETEEEPPAVLPYDAKRAKEKMEPAHVVPLNEDPLYVLYHPDSDADAERVDHEALVQAFREKCSAEQNIDINSHEYGDQCLIHAHTSRWNELFQDTETLFDVSVLDQPEEEFSLQDISDFYRSASRQACAFFTRQALHLALNRSTGLIGNTARLLIDVMLLQNEVPSSIMLDSWQDAAFQQLSKDGAFVAMHVAFRANWSMQASSYSVPESFLSLTLSTRTAPNDLTSQVHHSAIEILSTMSVVEAAEPGQSFWLFPNATVARYSDMLIALTYWRWLENLVSLIWRAAMKRNIPECFVFVAMARTVFSHGAAQVWHNLKKIVEEYKHRGLNKMILSDTSCSVEEFTASHERFLEQCMSVTLLASELGRARRTLRALARQAETVYHYLLLNAVAPAQDDKRSAERDFMSKKIKEFQATVELFVHQLEEVNSDCCKGIIESIKFSLLGFVY